jgi:hypothetical protein
MTMAKAQEEIVNCACGFDIVFTDVCLGFDQVGPSVFRRRAVLQSCVAEICCRLCCRVALQCVVPGLVHGCRIAVWGVFVFVGSRHHARMPIGY